MKILIVHNEYKKRGGEEYVVEMQIQTFRRAGYEVITYIRKYSEIETWRFGRLRSFFTALHNRQACQEVRRVVQMERPDVAFIHNLFPVISPAVLSVLKEEGVKIEMFVHNFRLLCPTGLFYHQGEICESCLGMGRELNCIRCKCEGSLAGSIAIALRSYWSRIERSYSGTVDRFICLTRFQKEKLIFNLQLPEERFAVVPNAIDLSAFPARSNISVKRSYFAFVGRLSPEKGVDLFFELARRLPQYRFKVAGEKNYELGEIPVNVELLGFLNRKELSEFYSGAFATVVTSRWYEGFPLTLLESMYYRTPLIIPDNKNLRSIIQKYPLGTLYEANRVESLVETVGRVVKNIEEHSQEYLNVEQVFSASTYIDRVMRTMVKKRNVKFSIITICYNAQNHILPTLHSVVAQRYLNIEYIVIDGASTDNTISLIEQFREHIAVLSSEPDKGIYDAMNKGLQYATGDYVLFMNAGDQFFDETVLTRIAEQLSLQKELPTVLYGETALLNEQREIIGMRRLHPPKRLTWKNFRMGMLVCHQSFMVRRDIAPLYDLTYKLSSDFDWCVRCLRQKGTVLNSHLTLSSYLQGGVSVQRHRESLVERFWIMKKWYGLISTVVCHLWFAIRK